MPEQAEAASGGELQAPLPAFATVDDIAGEPIVRAVEPTPHPTAAARNEAVIGPVPQTRAERDALLARMAAAPPDSENPFTSRKARLRRARLILQRLEQEQAEAAAKPFDWRTYRSATSHPAPATPPRVTA